MTRSSLSIAAPAALLASALLFFSIHARHAQADEYTTDDGELQLAQPGDFAFKLEPGFAFALSKPQSGLFDHGGGQTLKALWALNRHLDIGPSLSFIALPAETSAGAPGTAWTYGAGARLKRPHDRPAQVLSPWLDADILYVRTGGLHRPGFAVAAGLAVPIGKARVFWLGPFVRYLHIMQGERTGFDNRDAKILSLGLSLDVGSGIARRVRPERVIVTVAAPAPPPAPAPAPEIRTVTREVPVCPDRDQDKIPDDIDSCPDTAGVMESLGCPAYKKIIVTKDKLELKEKLFFARNQAVLKEESFPVLDDVVQALNDNKAFRVQVEGHTSSEGGERHNQTLSERRAQAVLDYLVSHGISKDRLVSKGFGASVPVDTNKTAAGREKNRRVEFLVNFIILNEAGQ